MTACHFNSDSAAAEEFHQALDHLEVYESHGRGQQTLKSPTKQNSGEIYDMQERQGKACLYHLITLIALISFILDSQQPMYFLKTTLHEIYTTSAQKGHVTGPQLVRCFLVRPLCISVCVVRWLVL